MSTGTIHPAVAMLLPGFLGSQVCTRFSSFNQQVWNTEKTISKKSLMFFTVFTHIMVFRSPCSTRVLWLVYTTWRIPQAPCSPSSWGCWFRVPYTALLQRAVTKLQTTTNAPNWNGRKHIFLGSLQCSKDETIWVTLALKTTINHCWGREFYCEKQTNKTSLWVLTLILLT